MAVEDGSNQQVGGNAVKSVRIDDSRADIILGGDIDILNADELQECLACCLEQGCSEIVVDMSMVPFIDSSGLRALTLPLKAERPIELTISHPSRQTRKVLAVSGLDVLVKFRPHLEDGETD